MQPSLTVFGFSDQFPVCLTWLKKAKTPTSGSKTTLGLSKSTILGVYNVSEPDAALHTGMGPSSMSVTSVLPLKLHKAHCSTEMAQKAHSRRHPLS